MEKVIDNGARPRIDDVAQKTDIRRKNEKREQSSVTAHPEIGCNANNHYSGAFYSQQYSRHSLYHMPQH
jgi:hypothetical protein